MNQLKHQFKTVLTLTNPQKTLLINNNRLPFLNADGDCTIDINTPNKHLLKTSQKTFSQFLKDEKKLNITIICQFQQAPNTTMENINDWLSINGETIKPVFNISPYNKVQTHHNPTELKNDFGAEDIEINIEYTGCY